MTPIHYVAWELEATLGGFVVAVKSAGELFLSLAMVLVLAGLLGAVVTARFRQEPRLRPIHRWSQRTLHGSDVLREEKLR